MKTLIHFEHSAHFNRYHYSYTFIMQGEEYEILDDSREHWWRAKDKDGYVYG